MVHPAIQISNLGKRYRLGGGTEAGQSFREMLSSRAAWWWRASAQPASQQEDANWVWALRGLDMEVPAGQAVGIVGHNGAGKSTLLKILSRITEPTTGRAVIRGRVGSLLEVGTGFHPELSGRENIYLSGAVLGMRRAEVRRRFEEIVAFSGVERFLDTPVKRYSSGMYVRLAFAVAAHLEPEVLVIDEVLAVGDAGFQRKCLGRMSQVSGSGRTVLFVSHNMAAIQQLCHRAVLLEAGRAAFVGSPAEAVRRYLDRTYGDQQTQGRVHVDPMPRGGDFGRAIRFIDWQLQDEHGRAINRLRFGQPVTVRTTLRAQETIEHAVFDVRLLSLEGTPIAAISNENEAGELRLQAGQTLRATFRLDHLHLVPGRYVLWLGVRTARTGLDFLPSAGTFEVTEELHQPDQPPHYHRALVHARSHWNFEYDGPLAQAA